MAEFASKGVAGTALGTGMVADITTGTGTTPQSTYNPLPVSTCGHGCGC